MKTFILVTLALLVPAIGSAQVRVMFSHQSVGRYIVADPERANPDLRASAPIRDFLNPNVAFWDHDYYNYSTDLATPGTWLLGSILDPAGDIWSHVLGFGPHRGSDLDDQLLDHLLGDAFLDAPDAYGQAFRDSIVSRFDITLVIPGYYDVRMNTNSSLADYQAMLESVSDWWHLNNPGKWLVVMTSSGMRHPSDYSGGPESWPDTPAGHAEAESDVAAYRELDLWLQDTWVHRHPENRYFSVWWRVVSHTGDATERYFTRDEYTGTGIGDSSGDHHLNLAGTNAVQAELAAFINDLAAEYDGSGSAVNPAVPSRVTLSDPVPNPFNPATVLAFELTETSEVDLSVYDLSGRRVRTLMNGIREAGEHRVAWNGRDQAGKAVPSGVYFYRIEAGDFAETRRMTLLK